MRADHPLRHGLVGVLDHLGPGAMEALTNLFETNAKLDNKSRGGVRVKWRVDALAPRRAA